MMYDKNFLVDSVALLQGKRSSHMGAHQYVDHGAIKNGLPMSGAALWREIALNRDAYYVLRAEQEMIPAVAKELSGFVPVGTPYVDLGPGTLETVANKSCALVDGIQSDIYVPIDLSLKFASEAGGIVQKSRPGIRVMPHIEDFFSDEVEPAVDQPGLAFLGGITIANIEANLSTIPPRQELSRALHNLATVSGNGWLLLSTDANQDEHENKSMYMENALFELNHFYRMADELPFSGFDPDGFVYDPYWIPESSQLAHTAIATKDMTVEVNSPHLLCSIDVARGQRFHLKNSFKFKDEFMNSCAQDANLEVLKVWTHSAKPMRITLMKAAANSAVQAMTRRAG